MYQTSMRQMIESLESDRDNELKKIKKEKAELILMLKKKSIDYFIQNKNECLSILENDFFNKVYDVATI